MQFFLLFVLCLQVLVADVFIETPILHGTLDNGMNYYVKENSYPKGRAFLQVVFKVGSLYEEDYEQGIAHFLEHLNFRGSENFDEEQLAKYLDSIGAHILSHNQASTSFERTEYHLDIPIEKEGSLDTALLFFRDFAGFATLSEEAIEKERHVVLDEMHRYFSSSGSRWFEKYLESNFPDSLFAKRLPIGTQEVISNVSAETLKAFYKKWYRPDRMALIAVGDFDGHELIGKIRNIFNAIINPSKEVATPEGGLVVPPSGQQVFHFDQELEGTSLLLLFSVPKTDLSHSSLAESIKKEGTDQCIQELLSDRLEARGEEGLFRDVGLQSDPFGSLDLLFLNAEIFENRFEDGIKAVFTELDRLKMYGFTDSELQRWKSEKKFELEQLMANLDKLDHEYFAECFLEHFMFNDHLVPLSEGCQLMAGFIDELTLEDLNSSLPTSFLNSGCTALLSTPSLEIQEAFEGKNLFSFAGSQDFLEPYSDRQIEFNMEPKTSPGTIINQKIDEMTGVVEWALSNGIKVFLKKTDLDRNHVYLSALANGGLSQFPEEDFPSASFAVWGLDGVKELSSYEAGLLFKSQRINFLPGLNSSFRSLDYSTDKNGLETVFQVLHTLFTEPRFDSKAWERIYTSVEESLNQSENDPAYQFHNFVSGVITGDHYTSKKMDLKDINPEKAKEAFQLLFGNPADFNILIVGDFDPEQMATLTKKYIASLPVNQRQERSPFLPPQPPSEKIQKDFVKGNQTNVTCLLNIPFNFESFFNRHSSSLALRGVVRLLQDRIWKVLRTDLGKTYDVRLDYNTPLTSDPSPSYLNLQFTCQADCRELMMDLALKEIEQFKHYVPTAEEITNIKAFFTEERKESSQFNSYWLSNLKFSQLFGLELAEMVDPLRVGSVDHT